MSRNGRKGAEQPVLPMAFATNAHAVLTRLDHLEDVSRWALAHPEVRMSRIVKKAPIRRRLLVPTDPLVLTRTASLGWTAGRSRHQERKDPDDHARSGSRDPAREAAP